MNSHVYLLPVRGLEDAFDVVLFEAVDVVGLDDFVDADERLLEGVERRRVDHLLLDLGCVRAPAHQEQFRPEMIQKCVILSTLLSDQISCKKSCPDKNSLLTLIRCHNPAEFN